MRKKISSLDWKRVSESVSSHRYREPNKPLITEKKSPRELFDNGILQRVSYAFELKERRLKKKFVVNNNYSLG